MKIIFSTHAEIQMRERGAIKQEVIETIKTGEQLLAKYGRISFRKNFEFKKKWANKFYNMKQVVPIVKKDVSKYIVITVYVFYF